MLALDCGEFDPAREQDSFAALPFLLTRRGLLSGFNTLKEEA